MSLSVCWISMPRPDPVLHIMQSLSFVFVTTGAVLGLWAVKADPLQFTIGFSLKTNSAGSTVLNYGS